MMYMGQRTNFKKVFFIIYKWFHKTVSGKCNLTFENLCKRNENQARLFVPWRVEHRLCGEALLCINGFFALLGVAQFSLQLRRSSRHKKVKISGRFRGIS